MIGVVEGGGFKMAKYNSLLNGFNRPECKSSKLELTYQHNVAFPQPDNSTLEPIQPILLHTTGLLYSSSRNKCKSKTHQYLHYI